VIPENFVYERFFGLAFYVDQQTSHCSQPGTGRPPNSFFSHNCPRL